MKYATFTSYEVDAVKRYLAEADSGDLFVTTLAQLNESVRSALLKPLDVPGQGEAGSYEHNQHKANYELMDQCARLYIYTGDAQSFATIRTLLLRYAEQYLGMPFHQQKNTNPPGRLFHQILNEHMWLFYASLSYDAIRLELPQEERDLIEGELLRPMIEMFTGLYGHDFDRIHNHGIWAVAAVGFAGLVVGDQAAVRKSIFGLDGDGRTGGFLAQISQLFSASGYYIEGPYYHRFALRPVVIFAEALNLHFPELDIYNYGDGVIGKTIKALLLSSNPDGTLPALNDASLTMKINDEGVLAALAIYFARYGGDESLVAAAKQQGRLWLAPCSLTLSRAVAASNTEAAVRWPSVELTEGDGGEKGAQGFLRSRAVDQPVTQAIMAYGQHGMGHGHFDTLSITLFSNGHEFLREYGFARWVNVETKFGGRYLDENKSWARQTIAHNGVTVDQKTQNRFDCQLADRHNGKRHFFITEGPVQAMSAYASDHYEGVDMQRTLLMIEQADFERPLILDLYRLSSDQHHQYDFAVHYRGQVTHTNLEYEYHLTERRVLGEDQGYQHLFEKARATAKATSSLTWLQDNSFHSWTTAATVGDEILFVQTGANDPAMNLRTEDAVLLRTAGQNHLFASAYESHGLFDEATERCYGALNQVQQIRVLHNDDRYSVVSVDYSTADRSRRLTLCVANQRSSDASTQHELSVNGQRFEWRGYFTLIKEEAA